MNTNFFTERLGFQKNLIDSSNSIGSKRDYTTSLKKNEFNTARSSQNNDANSSEKNKKFAEMMDSLNKNKQAQSKHNTDSTPKEKPITTKLYTSPVTNNYQLNIFHTEQSAIATQLNNIEPGVSGEDLQTDLVNIATLNEELQHLISEQLQTSKGDGETQITISGDTQSTADKIENILSTLAILLSNTDNANKEIKGAELIKDIEAIKGAADLKEFGNIKESHKLNNTKNIQSNNINEIIPPLTEIKDMSLDGSANAITTGLSIEQITKLQDSLKAYNNGELTEKEVEALENLVAQFISLTPPTKETTNDKPLMTRAQETSKTPLSKELAQQDAKILESVMAQPVANMANNERAENTIKDAPQPKTQAQAIVDKPLSPPPSATPYQEIQSKDLYDTRPESKYDSRYDVKYDNSEKLAPSDKIISEKGDFKAALKDIALPNAQNDNAKSSGQNFLQMSGLTGTNIEGSMQQSTALTGLQNTSSPLQSSLTNVITQSQNAGANHPATQMVSATIQKALKAGEATNIKLRLDPPELGRVDVKMSIDKDNITKIVLTVEKPETYMLLKQDIDILQRALSDTGLNADGNLEFELADDSHDFSNNNGENGANDHDKNNSSEDNLIETTMDWQVDPNTGRMHYNVLV